MTSELNILTHFKILHPKTIVPFIEIYVPAVTFGDFCHSKLQVSSTELFRDAIAVFSNETKCNESIHKHRKTSFGNYYSTCSESDIDNTLSLYVTTKILLQRISAACPFRCFQTMNYVKLNCLQNLLNYNFIMQTQTRSESPDR